MYRSESFNISIALLISLYYWEPQAIAAMSVSVKFGDLISQFDGSGDFLEWVEKLELVAELQGIQELHLVLPLFLTGGAFAVYKSIGEASKKDYDKVKGALRLAFSSDPIAAYEELQLRHLQPGESVDVYVSDLNRLAHLVDPTLSATYIKCAFICGLPSDVKKQLKAACNLAEMNLADVIDRARSLVKNGGDVCMVSLSRPNDRRTCFRCVKEGHMSRGCPAAVDDRRPSKSRVRCYTCGEEGHVSRDCRSTVKQSVRRCYVCGDESHMAPMCPKRFGDLPKND